MRRGGSDRSRVSSGSDSSSQSSDLTELEGEKVFCCSRCGTHLVDYGNIVSRAFHGRNGRAYLFEKVTNVYSGPKEERSLMTGLHIVRDIYCSCCGTVLGWWYERAFEPSQRYKEGKFILEKSRLMKEGEW